MWFVFMDRLGNGDGKVQLEEWLRCSELYNKHTSDEDFARGHEEMMSFMKWFNEGGVAAAMRAQAA